MNTHRTGKYRVRMARDEGDVERIDSLRRMCFRPLSGQSDLDEFDAICDHVLIEEVATGRLVCCYRLQRFPSGEAIEASYSSRFFDLVNLHKLRFPLIEVGRFCIHPAISRPDIPRLAWAMLAKIVEEDHAGLLFGCTSFEGQLAEKYGAAFALLEKCHTAPEVLKPLPKAPRVTDFGTASACGELDLSRAMKQMPQLLRVYLALGGWVSDHAVVDADLDTLHVFTGVETVLIPKSRARLLRADSLKIINML